LVGYPNSGKSSLVGALSRAKVKVGEYLYTTIIPASGMMPYKDTYIQLVGTPPLSVGNIFSGLIGTFKEADVLLVVIDLAADDCLEQLEGLTLILRDREVTDLNGEGDIIAPICFIVLGSKAAHTDAELYLQLLKELAGGTELLPVDINGVGLEFLKDRIYQVMDVIRVYGKPAGKIADMERPFILRRGSTMLDFAGQVH